MGLLIIDTSFEDCGELFEIVEIVSKFGKVYRAGALLDECQAGIRIV